MKLLKYILGSVVLIGLVACSTNEDKFPIPLAETLNSTGGFVRVVSVETAALDVGDLANAEFAFIGEVQDVNNGQDSESIVFYAAYSDVDGNEIPELPDPIASYNVSDFSIDENSGLPRGRMSVTFQDLLDAFGLEASDITIGDNFAIRWELRMKDGRVFSREDVSPDVGGAGFFSSPFFRNVGVVISLDPEVFVGSYTFTQDDASTSVAAAFANGWIWNGAQSFTVDLTVDPDNNLVGRLFDAQPLAEFGAPVRTYALQFGLFTTLAGGQPTGLGCGGVAIRYSPASTLRGSFDPTDDSTFQFVVTENELAACGQPTIELTFTATKN